MVPITTRTPTKSNCMGNSENPTEKLASEPSTAKVPLAQPETKTVLERVVLCTGKTPQTDVICATLYPKCRKQLKRALAFEEKENCRTNLTVKVEEKNESDDTNQKNKVFNTLFTQFFGCTVPIDCDFVGGKLSIIGSEERAACISNKFKIMKKLGHLVGCGLDCHFRLTGDRFRLLMLVRGVPGAIFGANLSVVPEVSNIQSFSAPAEFVEVSQNHFFNKILSLLPSRLKDGKQLVQTAMDNGDENDKVLKFYEFLKTIRNPVLNHMQSIPFAWTIADHSNDINHECSEEIRSVMQLCGDSHLMALERTKLDYGNSWEREWGLVSAPTFSQRMEDEFYSF